MPITLDRRGYITPYQAVPSTMEKLKGTFVTPFPKASHRHEIYAGYEACIKVLIGLVGSHTQWVNGSFTTTKISPRDIDVLCFISSEAIMRFQSDLNQLKDQAKMKFKVDMYILSVPSKNDPRYKIFEMDKVYWLNQFTKTKKIGHRKVQYDKGFLELKIK